MAKAGKTATANVFFAKEAPTQWEGVNKYTVMDPDLEIGGGPIIPDVDPDDIPHPSHPIALPGDGIWGGDLHPEHPIVLPPDGEGPPIVDAPVMAAVLPSANAEPVPATVNLPAGSQRVMMYFGPGTVAFEWYLPPLATPKQAKK